ncbi:hypothetical protein DERF_004406 [Dermatophagoides farinae]|uniref:Uncharacterized protein n=1 Tax=Dermatophagoides farinae TaxID=6954 RepID=A0A922I4X6_DERFA|nr:hypothetical protein DERF_004406 [Dermatophagoides farinae]
MYLGDRPPSPIRQDEHIMKFNEIRQHEEVAIKVTVNHRMDPKGLLKFLKDSYMVNQKPAMCPLVCRY